MKGGGLPNLVFEENNPVVPGSKDITIRYITQYLNNDPSKDRTHAFIAKTIINLYILLNIHFKM